MQTIIMLILSILLCSLSIVGYGAEIETTNPHIVPKENCFIDLLDSVVRGLKTSLESSSCQQINGKNTNQNEKDDTKTARNCFDLYNRGMKASGIGTIYPYQCCPQWEVKVSCDQITDEGGWTVIQARDVAFTRKDFYRSFAEYSLGFGNLNEEFWLGLNIINAITNSELMELRVDLVDGEGAIRYAKYGYFVVGNSAEKYIISVGSFSGDAGDGLSPQNQMKFSARDQDNDIYNESCSTRFKGGWWYSKCHSSNLNGFQYVGNHTSYADGITWSPFRGQYHSMKKVRMMVRPAFRNNF